MGNGRDAGGGGEVEAQRPDVEIAARVTARRLRFAGRPEASVEFEGAPEHRSSSESDRTNLPDPVEPGVTYRDVEVRWRAAARVVDRRERRPATREDEPADG